MSKPVQEQKDLARGQRATALQEQEGEPKGQFSEPLETHGKTTPVYERFPIQAGGPYALFEVGREQSVYQTVPGEPEQGRKVKARSKPVSK